MYGFGFHDYSLEICWCWKLKWLALNKSSFRIPKRRLPVTFNRMFDFSKVHSVHVIYFVLMNGSVGDSEAYSFEHYDVKKKGCVCIVECPDILWNNWFVLFLKTMFWGLLFLNTVWHCQRAGMLDCPFSDVGIYVFILNSMKTSWVEAGTPGPSTQAWGICIYRYTSGGFKKNMSTYEYINKIIYIYIYI